MRTPGTAPNAPRARPANARIAHFLNDAALLPKVSVLMTNGVVVLLRHPAQLDRLRRDPGLWPTAVEEILRYDPPLTAWNRQALDDRQTNGCPVHAGQTITSMLVAANHEPALHGDAHEFDIDRAGKKHFSFGGGAHFCLGASLARMEGWIAFALLFERFARLKLADSRPLRRKAYPGFRGYEAVWLEGAGSGGR